MTGPDTAPRPYPPGQHPDLPPPPGSAGLPGWLRANLFSSIGNTLLTLVFAGLLVQFISAAIDWFILGAVTDAASRAACRQQGSGACWAVIAVRVEQFTYGFYPAAERWRPNLAFVLMFVALAPILFDGTPYRRKLMIFSLAYPFIAGWLIHGGPGLQIVDTHLYGGFLLTLIVGVTGIVASLPLGIGLALGRQSRLLSVRIICISFIEFMRGVPLITLLFVASTMLNYFLPPGTSFNLLVRVLIMVTLFASAYVAGSAARRGCRRSRAASTRRLTRWGCPIGKPPG